MNTALLFAAAFNIFFLVSLFDATNEDKYAATGLTPIVEGNYAYIGEASQVLFCRKMYDAVVDIDCASDYMKDMLSNQLYPEHDNHHMIYGEITKVIKQ